MRAVRFMAGVVAIAAVCAGCASGDEWRTWWEHPTHFASGDHMSFSVKNGEGDTPQVTRKDVSVASHEGWWGKPVAVAQEQILER
jgi:hypothetical protein